MQIVHETRRPDMRDEKRLIVFKHIESFFYYSFDIISHCFSFLSVHLQIKLRRNEMKNLMFNAIKKALHVRTI
jgi:hypothetical protein